MNIRPLREWLVVRPDMEPSVTPAGILLLTTEDDGLVKRVVTGTVMAVGPGNDAWGIKPDMNIAYSPVGAVDAPDKLKLIRRGSVVGVVQ